MIGLQAVAGRPWRVPRVQAAVCEPNTGKGDPCIMGLHMQLDAWVEDGWDTRSSMARKGQKEKGREKKKLKLMI